ncbi:hypothetical protein CROQUDRAFT_660993 [Cronartium quercuum f. sp. fusiforme G11]|uniref:NF-kappa-B-activating protein C-terminal domain-containing protein n=1 Tax=Cronartium quercuum f. sp. fusiforme G11 TaxID=708437 RepID=A0A9P6NGL1_9BASI|nr:hypothetical protein CROQUDRAFT_660993 [Cronartium quercuum f. sp. fusiforme G11]
MPQERSRAIDFDDRPQSRYPRQSPSPTRSGTPPSPRHQTRSSEPYSRRRNPDARASPDYDRGNERSRARLTPDRALDDRSFRNHDRSRQDGPGYGHEGPRNATGGGGYQTFGRGDQRNGYGQGGRDDFFESRRLEREHVQVSFWPPSPPRAYKRDAKEDTREKNKKHKSTKSKSKSKSKSHRHRRSRYSDDDETDDGSDSEADDRRRKRKHSSHHHSSRHHRDSSHKRRKPSATPSTEDALEAEEEEEVVWEEKPHSHVPAPRKESIKGPALPAAPPPAAIEAEEEGSDSDPTEVGPMPYNPVTGKAMDPKEFGRALRPGEGSAMAAFIEAGERIPRRGEIGLKGPQIEKFEQAGYVMSGSRHRRMNAVRIRKENQVISAEEKRGILKMQAEEKAKREGQIISSFRELVDTKLQETS